MTDTRNHETCIPVGGIEYQIYFAQYDHSTLAFEMHDINSAQSPKHKALKTIRIITFHRKYAP